RKWIRTCLNFALAFTLFGYGAAKLLPAQFPQPPLSRMLTPFGESSQRGLLWTFMGMSRAYALAAGAAEVTSGILLCFSRTALAGAIGACAMMAHIVLLNLCYDVQLKLATLHL